MRLVVLTCLWERSEIAEAVLRHLSWAAQRLSKHGIKLEVLVVGSDGEDDAGPRQLAEAGNAWYISHPNNPVSLKWRAGGLQARELNPDALMICGSDDFVSVGYMRAACDLVAKGWHYVNARGLMYMDADWDSPFHGYAFQVRTSRPGAGRVLSRELLERAEWKLWPEDGVDRLCDTAMDRRLWADDVGIEPEEQAFVKFGETSYGWAGVLASKGAVSMWSFSDLLLRHLGSRKDWSRSDLDDLLTREYPAAVPLIHANHHVQEEPSSHGDQIKGAPV